MTKPMGDEETIKFFRSILKKIDKRSGKDRRFSFFSFLVGDRRSGNERRK